MPTMPSLPSRKLSKLWSGSSSKSPASAETETSPADDDKKSLDDRTTGKDVSQLSQQRLKQLFIEKDKGGDGLAADINLRRKTNERLYSAVEAYWSSLEKPKPLPFEMSGASALEIAMTLDEAKNACQTLYPNSSPLVLQAAEEGSKSVANGKERMLPLEALGLAMASCANTYSRSEKEDTEIKKHLRKNEAYASHLSHLSAVHLALAQLQADYTSSLSSTLLNRLARSQAAIEALRTTEKGTEAAKEKMEAAEKRLDKAKEKGDKNRRDAEEEARMSRATYEEALADLEARTEILRESEQRGPCSGVAILKEYMDVHLAWVEAQHDVLSRARSSLDLYPANQIIPPTKTRAAPPPPPSSVQTVARRIVEPPPLLKEEQRKRSVSSSHTLHKPKMSSRSSLNDMMLKSRMPKEEEGAQRPFSRSSNSIKDVSSSRGLMTKIPFARSESYTASNTYSDALEGDMNNKNEGKKSRIGDIRATFARSTSSLGHNMSDATTTTKTTPSTTGGTGTEFSGSERSSWAGNLLSRKNKDPKKGDGTYQVMMGDEEEADQSRRSLSHVQETSTESKSGLEDVIFMQHLHQPSIVDPNSDNLQRQNVHDVQSHHLKLWEKFESRRDSLGVSHHLTGNTVSSVGSNPFGYEGGDLSPMGTGNGQFQTWGPDVSGDGDDHPGDVLLGVGNGTGIIRKSMKR